MADTYKKSGVNIKAGYESVERIKKHVKSTKTLGVMGGIGDFGGLFDLSLLKIKEPILVSGTDGVGTKLMIAFLMDKHDTIGIDAVAMCVNDVLAQGAKPLFFLDYIAVGKNNPLQIESIVKGVSDGCKLSGCALIGGETAEMPDMYENGHYDIAGFSTGVVEKEKIINKENVELGDILIGLPSSGLHSNGFSLVRKVLLKDNKLDLFSYYEEINNKLGDELLTPTKIYVKAVLDILSKVKINAISHITGGGFDENLQRVLNDGQGILIKENSWPKLAIFDFIEKLGKIPHREMFNIFNMGIGMVLVVNKKNVNDVLDILKINGEIGYVIGEVANGEGVKII